jgi:NAD(P)H-hydrate epimerase
MALAGPRSEPHLRRSCSTSSLCPTVVLAATVEAAGFGATCMNCAERFDAASLCVHALPRHVHRGRGWTIPAGAPASAVRSSETVPLRAGSRQVIMSAVARREVHTGVIILESTNMSRETSRDVAAGAVAAGQLHGVQRERGRMESAFVAPAHVLSARHTAVAGRCLPQRSMRMCDAPLAEAAPPPRRAQFVSGAVGRRAQADAITHAKSDALSVAQRCGDSVVEALMETYSLKANTAVFVVCGPGFNGLVGACAAGTLKEKGYEPTVFLLEGSLPGYSGDACADLKKAGIAVCDFVPSTLDFYFDVVVDALFGVGFDGGDVRAQYWNVFEMLVKTELPIVSVDMPSGWDLETGPRQIDVNASTFLRPDVLVSLGVPKNGAKVFAGQFHYVGGRGILPPGWTDANNVALPAFRGADAACALLSSSVFHYRNSNGEAYGRPGKFEATLWDPNSRRKWVSDEDAMEMDIMEWE